MYYFFEDEDAFDIFRDMMFLKFSRTHELEADECGLHIMIKAGFNPDALSEFFKKLQSQKIELFSTHPSSEHRIQSLQDIIKKKYYDKIEENSEVQRISEIFKQFKSNQLVQEQQSKEKSQNAAKAQEEKVNEQSKENLIVDKFKLEIGKFKCFDEEKNAKYSAELSLQKNFVVSGKMCYPNEDQDQQLLCEQIQGIWDEAGYMSWSFNNQQKIYQGKCSETAEKILFFETEFDKSTISMKCSRV